TNYLVTVLVFPGVWPLATAASHTHALHEGAWNGFFLPCRIAGSSIFTAGGSHTRDSCDGNAAILGTRWIDCRGPVRDPPDAIEHSVQVRAAHNRDRVARDPQVCGSALRELPLDR